MKKTLHLRREALAELSVEDLAAVAGGATVGDHCGPPFDTRFLDQAVASLETIVVTRIPTGCYCA